MQQMTPGPDESAQSASTSTAKVACDAGDPDPPLPKGVQLTALDGVFRDDPYPILKRLRDSAPVHFDEELCRWYVTRFEDVRQLLRDKDMSSDPRKANPGSYASRLSANGAAAGPGAVSDSILLMDDPDHRRLRSLVSKGFAPKAIEALRPRIREIADELIDRIPPGEFDLIESFAGPLPVMVIAEMLGIDAARRGDFKRWSDVIAAAFFNPVGGAEQSARAREAQRSMNDYFVRTLELRRHQPGEDLISEMICAREDDQYLTDQEIVTQCNLLLIAGNITTTDLIGNGMKALLDHSEQLAILRTRPELMANAVEEMLRYDTPVTQTSRNLQTEMTLRSCPMHRGDSIALSLAAANHDPQAHADPERFDVQRAEIRHQSFGGGRHLCLGASLARAEGQEAIAALLQRLPTLRVSPRGFRYRGVPGLRGLAELWLNTGSE